MSDSEDLLTFGGHLEVLRRMVVRILAVTLAIAAVAFAMKDAVFAILFAPAEYDFVTWRTIAALMQHVDPSYTLQEFHVDMIATGLSSQFMTHVTTALVIGLLGASPVIVLELFGFVAPAINNGNRARSAGIACVMYMLFIIGVLVSYYILFPVSFRFLGTYSIAGNVQTMVTIDSYVASFASLTLAMGIVFQLPVLAWRLGRLGIFNAAMLASKRRHAIVVITLLAAVITPPDIMTLVLVALPLCLLYELSIHLVPRTTT